MCHCLFNCILKPTSAQEEFGRPQPACASTHPWKVPQSLWLAFSLGWSHPAHLHTFPAQVLTKSSQSLFPVLFPISGNRRVLQSLDAIKKQTLEQYPQPPTGQSQGLLSFRSNWGLQPLQLLSQGNCSSYFPGNQTPPSPPQPPTSSKLFSFSWGQS